MELANDSKFSGERTTITTCSFNMMGTKKKYKSADDDRMQAYDNMNGVRPKAAAWRPTHSRYAQNTLTTELISGSFLHDRTDEHNQLTDESKEQKQTEDLAGIQAHHHEQQVLLPRSLDENQTKFRDEHNRIYRSYNVRQRWKRKLIMNSSCEESCRL